MKGIAAPLVALACSIAPGLVQAIAIDYSTGELVTVRSCVPGVTACDSVSPIIQSEFGGAPGASTSTASTSLAGFGSADGSVSLSGVIGAPVLRARAVSELGARTNTNSWALQRYTYTGTDPTTRTFGGSLTYSQSVTGPYGPGVGDGIYAAIVLFTLTDATIEVGDTAQSNAAVLADPGALPGFAAIGFQEFSDSNSTSSGLAQLGVTATLNSGDSIWVWAILQTPAANGADVNSLSTFITAWDDSTNLIPAVVATVPEPGTLALLWIGLAGVAFARLHRQHQRRSA